MALALIPAGTKNAGQVTVSGASYQLQALDVRLFYDLVGAVKKRRSSFAGTLLDSDQPAP